MKRFIYTLTIILLGTGTSLCQNTRVKGRIIDTNSSEAIPDVDVRIKSSHYSGSTNVDGLFNIEGGDLPQGEQVLLVSKNGYLTLRIPIVIQVGNIIDLDPILMAIDLTEMEAQIGIISLSENELDEDEGTFFNISGLLQASNDVFLNAAAFDFSATFFRPRGLDNANGKVLINGIEMNKQFTGRPQWGNWGGLNDAQRNREFSMGIKANEYNFGDVAGTNNIIMRASQYRKGGRISFATANRSYTGRVMGSYNSGLTKNGWAYSLLLSKRFAAEGYLDGTVYDANSFFASVEKKINEIHTLNLSVLYTPNRRGRSSAVTREVKDLKGIRYNPNWGYQDGKIRNSRIREINEPIVLINHYWNINDNTTLNTNIGYQFGKVGNSRLDSGGNRNPAGNYYQRLPSYFLRSENPTSIEYQQAYLAEQQFLQDGQLNWHDIYAGNLNSTDGLSKYTIQEDRVDDVQITVNTILNSRISDNISVNGNVNYRSLKSENFSLLTDLLGGSGYLDIDNFGDGGLEGNSDLQNPNRVVQVGERNRYNYVINATAISGFAQAQINYNKVDLYTGITVSKTNYQRTGLYNNGYFGEEGRSLGKSEKIDFTNFGAKGGFIYKLTGRHLIDFNAGILTKAPSIRNSFANARQNNDVVVGLSVEKIQNFDLGYIYRNPIVQARLTGYLIRFLDQTDIGFFFTQNALGNEDSNAFVQEIVTGIDKRNAGIQLGIEAQVLPTFKIKAAASVGQNLYIKNSKLYLAGDDFVDGDEEGVVAGTDIATLGIREVAINNYHVSGGPEQVFQLGFDYRDPEFWWVGCTTNYYSNSYIDISNLRRTPDFYTDFDGQVFNEYNEETARHLLRQEQLQDYFLVNIVGGKSWRVKSYFVGFFATINNILNQEYITGGFEDSRRASYRQQLEEQGRDTPIFGNRYFFGNGTTYYINAYVRF